MIDWVHCNKCSVKYNPQSFFLVQCGHIFCERCVERIKVSKRCLFCNKNGNIIPLNKDAEQSVLEYFMPVETLFKKTIEVYKFQLLHRNTLVNNLIEKYNIVKKENFKCFNSNKHLMKENQMLRSMLRSTGKNPQRFMTSTPVSQTSENNMTFQNTSMMSSIPPHMGRTPSRDNSMRKMYPGYPKRSHIFGSGSSPAQTMSFLKFPDQPAIHQTSIGTMHSLEELRRSKK